MSNFTNKEKKSFLLKKFIKEHIFDFVMDMIINIAFVLLVVYFCEGTNYIYGIIMAVVYSIGKSVNNIKVYKKDYLDIDVK